MLTVHLRVNDAATSKPTPVRVRLTDAQGNYHAPFGRLTHFAVAPGADVGGQVSLSGRAFAYIDGTCEVHLPAGDISVEITKGPEYSPIQRIIPLAAGQISLRQTIERWTDWRELGWYAGDVRAHALSPRAALLEGAAEGLALVHLLARERPASDEQPGSLAELLEFSGNVPALASADCAVEVNTLNVHPRLGSVALLHTHRPVYPLRSGDPGSSNWSVLDWCDQCHRKTGLVVWPDLHRGDGNFIQGEALAALILGKIDAYEIAAFPSADLDALTSYYQLLNSGLRPALVGGSGKDCNALALGSVRTYARLLPETSFSPDAWINAVRAGRTFITTGPLLSIRVGDHGPGEVISCTPGQRLPIAVEAQSTVPFDDLELLAGGDIIASKSTSGNRQATQLQAEYRCQRSTWLAARCVSNERLLTGQIVFAHTNSVWLDVPAQPIRPSAETVKPLLESLADTASWLEGAGLNQIREGIEQARQLVLSRGEQ